ncbi:MAG TPA: VIT and VWA domain-containing protein [Chthonomonadales bacterium]|nr:VIT and VWA domain-containing protein [Chthonomonadales bacterium]
MRSVMRQISSLLALTLLSLVMVNATFAQGILYPRPEVREWPFSVRSVRITSAISETLAETTVEQTFVNNSSVEQEGTYLFPLPEGATITSFTLQADKRVLEGRLLGKEEARNVYESIVRRRKDPALLEYIGRGMFRASVFPIPPRGERVLTLKYAEVVPIEGTMRRFSYPLSTGRFSSRPIESLSVSIKLKTKTPLRTVYSPSHDVSVSRTDDYTATASWEGRGEFPDRDLTLYYATSTSDVGLNLLTYESGDRPGYFVLIAAPRFSTPREQILPKQVVFVLDRTGSMRGDNKIEQAKGALRFCLDSLHPTDRFNVITFNEGTDLLAKSLLPASPENVKKAKQFVQDIEASGGTNIDEALRTALTLLRDIEGSQKMIVFLTDGLPTVGETNVEKILENVRAFTRGSRLASTRPVEEKLVLSKAAGEMAGVRARIFCFGVGYDVNVPFLDRLAEETGADADYVRPEENIERIVSAFYAKISSPILTNLRLAFEGVETFDIYPRNLPDLYTGSQIVIAGRYRGKGSGTVSLAGWAQGKENTFRLTNAFGESATRSTLVPRIWAARKIGYLLDEVRLHQNREVIEEIIRLSKEYGILTPYTTYLADERQDMAVRERALLPEAHAPLVRYDMDNSVIVHSERQAREKLLALTGRGRSSTGVVETHRSLSAKGYQKADRAPASTQGEVAGGLDNLPAIIGGTGVFGQRGHTGGSFGGVGVPHGPALLAPPRKTLAQDFADASKIVQDKAANTPGYKQIQASARVQAVAGRVFYRRNNIWFDKDYQSGQKVIKVKALSDAHFQLLRAMPRLSKYTSVGEEVVLVLGKAAVQIGKEGKEKLTPAEIKDLTGKV